MRIRGWLIFLLLIAVVALAIGFGTYTGAKAAEEEKPDIFAPQDKTVCLACHQEKVNVNHFASSAHGKLNCQDCHHGVDRYPHPATAVLKPRCQSCHTDKDKALMRSVHGHAAPNAQRIPPNCQACHGQNPHEIAKPTGLSPELKEASCRSCHADKAAALAGSVHGVTGKKAHAGQTPGCLACHGGNPHTIAPPAKIASPKQDAPCLRCHKANTGQMLADAHGRASLKAGKRLSCLTCHGGNPHAITSPMKAGGALTAAVCEKCHADKAKLLANSAHGHTDMQAGNRPNCLTCHGERLHAISPTAGMKPTQKDAACRKCHQDVAANLTASVHGHAGKSAGGSQSCLTCHGGNPHDVAQMTQLNRTTKEAACKTCHAKEASSLQHSVHDRPDKVPGDHPTCLFCHNNNPHRIGKPAQLAPKEKVALCAQCHADAKRMARYGRVDAVTAYERTYHGRAITLFHHTKEATCVDCHGLHGIMDPQDPNSPVNQHHAAQICGKCHHGNNMIFAYSYASHLRMNVERSIVNPVEVLFTRSLTLLSLLGIAGLCTLGICCTACNRSYMQTAQRYRDLYTAAILFAFVTAITLLLSVLLIHRLIVADVRWAITSALGLLLFAVIALLAKRFLFRTCPSAAQASAETSSTETH